MTDIPSTPASGPGRPKDPAKREAILDAAKRLFILHGYEGSSMDAIAAEAGVSKLTLYSHFASKENLFAAAVASKCQEQLPPLFFERTDEVPLEQVLLDVGRRFHQLIHSEESVAMHRLMIAQGAQNPQLSQQFFNAGPQRLLDAMQQLLERADRKGQLRVADPLRAADHFFSMLKGACHLLLLIGACTAPQGDEAEAQVRDVVRLFLRAYARD
jgi:TetR/AcrR family transcriptional repressor of mexJK operon